MSSDNGIYILETPKGDGKEYRVAHLQAVENYLWHVCSKHGFDLHFGNDGRPGCDECRSGECDHVECHIENAREMWGDCKVFTNQDDALKFALDLANQVEWTEYGICSIIIPKEF